MNPEKMLAPFLGQAKALEDSQKINEEVDSYYKKRRAIKSKPKTEVAAEKIKEKKNKRIFPPGMDKQEQRWFDNLREARVTILTDGFLEIPRWDNTGEHFENPARILQKVDGINSAIRMQDHIIGQYRVGKEEKKSELEQIESIQEVIEYANELLTRWKTVGPEEKKGIQMQLADVVLQLENCRNEFKVNVLEQSEKVMKLKDKRDRENPGALAAITVSSLNNLGKRINETQQIMPVMAMRKEILILEKRRIENAIRKSKAKLSGILHHPVFKEGTNKEPAQRINDNEVDILDKKIGKVLHLLDTVRIFPYMSQADQAKFFLTNKAKRYFTSKKRLTDNLDTVKEALKDSIDILESNIEHLD